MTERKKKPAKELWIFSGTVFVLFLIFAWRQFYGFNKNDEIFYISTVHRFFQGDAMLVDEWNNAELFTLITYPLYSLVRLFVGSNEGIVVIFRMMYLLFQALAAFYCFFRMRRLGWIRILPALYYFVTTPYNINSLSYNTLAFGFLLLCLVTLSCTEQPGFFDFFLCGLFCAGAVLSNPYAVMLFLLYGMLCVGAFFYGRNRERNVPPVLLLKNYAIVCLGAFFIFVIFLTFVFSRASWEEVTECIPYIVMDTERQKSFWEKFAKYFVRIHRYYRVQVYVTGVLAALWLADRKRMVQPCFYLLAEMVTAVPYVVYYGFFWEMVGINYVLIPLAFPGVIAWLVSRDRDKTIFYGWYIPGLLYTLLAHFASDTGILIVSASCMIASSASMVLLWNAVREQGRTAWLRALTGLLFAVQFAACIWQRITYVWGDEHLNLLTEELVRGPLKGVHTSVENKELYEDVLLDVDELFLTSEDKLFVLGIAPWIYLYTEAECAACSTWEILETDPLIPVYYELRPEKLPDVVYCYEYDERILETEFAYYFTDMGYEPVEMRRGMVFLRP